jgi:multidrug resistance efflux pump
VGRGCARVVRQEERGGPDRPEGEDSLLLIWRERVAVHATGIAEHAVVVARARRLPHHQLVRHVPAAVPTTHSGLGRSQKRSKVAGLVALSAIRVGMLAGPGPGAPLAASILLDKNR